MLSTRVSKTGSNRPSPPDRASRRNLITFTGETNGSSSPSPPEAVRNHRHRQSCLRVEIKICQLTPVLP
jgi:hypothetical protein